LTISIEIGARNSQSAQRLIRNLIRCRVGNNINSIRNSLRSYKKEDMPTIGHNYGSSSFDIVNVIVIVRNAERPMLPVRALWKRVIHAF